MLMAISRESFVTDVWQGPKYAFEKAEFAVPVSNSKLLLGAFI